MSVDLCNDDIQDTVEKYHDLMRGVGMKTALREIENTDIDVESLFHKQKYIITHAPFPEPHIQYESEIIDIGTVGGVSNRNLIFVRQTGPYNSVVDLTRKGLLYRAILIATKDFDPEYTYEQKVERVS